MAFRKAGAARGARARRIKSILILRTSYRSCRLEGPLGPEGWLGIEK
jgi:hypothetical protein